MKSSDLFRAGASTCLQLKSPCKSAFELHDPGFDGWVGITAGPPVTPAHIDPHRMAPGGFKTPAQPDKRSRMRAVKSLISEYGCVRLHLRVQTVPQHAKAALDGKPASGIET